MFFPQSASVFDFDVIRENPHWGGVGQELLKGWKPTNFQTILTRLRGEAVLVPTSVRYIVVELLIKCSGCVIIMHVSCKWIGGRVNFVKTVARASRSPRLSILRIPSARIAHRLRRGAAQEGQSVTLNALLATIARALLHEKKCHHITGTCSILMAACSRF